MNSPPDYQAKTVYPITTKVAIPAGLRPHGPYAEHVAVLASILLILTICVEERRNGYWIPFPCHSWQTLFGRNYMHVKQAARLLGYFEFNEKYSTDIGFSKSIRLAKQFRSWSHRMYTLTNPRLIKRLRKWRRNEDARMDVAGLYLVRCFDDFQLTAPQTLVRRQNGWVQLLILSIQDGQCFARRCRFGRFHSGYTVLPKTLRRKITSADNTSTTEVDISNCQPLLLGLLVKKINPSVDVGRYLKLCSDGNLYQFLQSRIEPEVYRSKHGTLKNRHRTRNYVKETFFRMLFGTVGQTIRNPCFDVIRSNFPTIADHVLEMKIADGYQSVAHRCQRFESQLMIDGVVMRLKDQQIPVITIHDSLICSANKVEYVIDAIKQAFAAYGVSPSLGQH